MNGYTIQQAATILAISPQRVRQMVPKGANRIGGMIFLTIGQIQKMGKRNTKPGPKPSKKGKR